MVTILLSFFLGYVIGYAVRKAEPKIDNGYNFCTDRGCADCAKHRK